MGLIYFWDARDGAGLSGWWFGPKVGGDQVWAVCNEDAKSPPTAGWKVPCNGPVDKTFIIIAAKGKDIGASSTKDDTGKARQEEKKRKQEAAKEQARKVEQEKQKLLTDSKIRAEDERKQKMVKKKKKKKKKKK